MTATQLPPAHFVEVPAAGVVRKKRSLPNARALAGAVLVTAALVGVFAVWLRAGSSPGRRYVVARHAITAGTRLRTGDLALATMTLPVSMQPLAFTDPATLIGRVAAGRLAGGELVQASAVLGPAESFGLRQVAVAVDTAEAAAVEPGQPVDVLVTHGSGDTARTDLVVAGAQVLRVARVDASAVGDRSGAIVTLGTPTFADVQALVHATRTGQVDVVPGSATDRFFSTPNQTAP